MIADVTPLPGRGRAFGFHRAADHFGSIPGALIAWWLLSRAVEVRQVLTWSVVPGLLAGVVLLVVLRGAPEQGAAAGHQPSMVDATGRVFWGPVLALVALVLLRLPETLLLLRLQHLGVSVATIPLVWAGLHVVRSVGSYPGGWLVDHLGSRVTVAAGGVCFAAGAFALGFPLSVAAAVLVFLALGNVAGLTEAAERSLVARLAPKRTGRGFGAYHGATGLAALPAALLFGALYQDYGGATALWASAGGMILAVMVWLFLARTVTAT
jgi:dipeptide/tripeptide permease